MRREVGGRLLAMFCSTSAGNLRELNFLVRWVSGRIVEIMNL